MIAAVAEEYGGTICSNDRDFARAHFRRVRIVVEDWVRFL
jgi:predicted nucleic acid-binding protein